LAYTGHAHPNVGATIHKAAKKLLHICSTDFYYGSFARVCERLAKLAPGPEPKRVFLTNSGTEATEGAIKLVRAHTKRQNIIAFQGSFHGRTMGAISVGASRRVRAAASSMASGIPSNRRQTCATARAFSWVTTKLGRMEADRSTNSRTDSYWVMLVTRSSRSRGRPRRDYRPKALWQPCG